MRREVVFTCLLSFLLIGLGFLLGRYYALNGGLIRGQSSINWTVPSLFFSRVETFDYTPLLGTFTLDADMPGQEPLKADLHFPARVGRLNMDKLISGKEALEHAQRMHGYDAPIVRVFIPYYSSADEQVTVWVFEMDTALEARKHLGKINERMSALKDGGKFGSFFLQDVEVYYLNHCHTDNYYYRKDNMIYWVSLNSSDPIPLFLRFYEYF